MYGTVVTRLTGNWWIVSMFIGIMPFDNNVYNIEIDANPIDFSIALNSYKKAFSKKNDVLQWNHWALQTENEMKCLFGWKW